MIAGKPTPRRVLFIAPQPFFEWRGTPIRVSFDLRALVTLGCEVDLLTLPIGQPWELPGVRVHRAWPLPGVRQVPIGPSPAKCIFDILLFLKGLRLVLRRRYAVVHGVEEAGALAVILAFLGGGCAVYERHSDPASHRRHGLRNLVLRLYACVERWTARRADAVIATGPGLAAQTQTFAGRTPVHDIFDIPSSLVEADPAAVARVRAQWAPQPGDLVALYVGSFAVYQGVDLIFDSVAAVRAADPRVRFVVITGAPREAIDARRTALAQAGVANAVTFLDPIPPDALPNYLGAADIVLSPRRSGVNTPLKLLDYLKAGRAILATDTPANRLILSERNASFVAAAPEALAAGLVRLAGDAALRERLGHAAREEISRTYNFEGFRARLNACYASLPPKSSSLVRRLWGIVGLFLLALAALAALVFEMLGWLLAP